MYRESEAKATPAAIPDGPHYPFPSSQRNKIHGVTKRLSGQTGPGYKIISEIQSSPTRVRAAILQIRRLIRVVMQRPT